MYVLSILNPMAIRFKFELLEIKKNLLHIITEIILFRYFMKHPE